MACLRFPIAILAVGALVIGFATPAGAQGLQRDPGQNIYAAACASRHYRGTDKAPFGTRGLLADGRPDGLVQ